MTRIRTGTRVRSTTPHQPVSEYPVNTEGLADVAAQPVPYPVPSVGSGGWVVARTGVVEERVVGVGVDDYLVDQPGAVQRRLGGVLRRGHPVVERSVDGQHRDPL